MAKQYITPKIYVRLVNMEVYITSGSNYRRTMIKTGEDPITNAEEILTKERPFFDDGDNTFGLKAW